MPKLGEAFVVIRAALGPLKAGLAAARSAVSKAMSMVTDTIKKAMSFSYKWIKRALLAISGALTASYYAFAKFSEQMANVSTMLDEQSMHFMPRYSKAIKQMALDFGEGTASLSKGLYDILSASIAPARALEVLGVAAKAAKAGLTTTAVAADAITTILNAYRMSADKAGNVSDILFATVKRGKLTFEELAQSVGKVAATASVAGLSFEEVSAAIATMTRSGLNAFIATTALRSIMSGFLKPMESAKKAAKELGIELNSTTLRTIGLTGVLEKLKGASAEQLAALIPNRRALAGFAAMVKNTTGQLFDLNLMLNSAGLTQKAYEKMTSTLKFSLDKLKQSFVILATTMGSTLAPAFKFITDITVGSVKKWIDYLEKHKFEVMRWAVAVTTRLNFVRGVLQDFAVGAFKNWPETWKFMKDVAVGQLDVIWKSFTIAGQAAVEILVEQFKALGKSLGHIFGKVWSDFENRAMVAGQRAIAKQIEYQREYRKALKDIKKETGHKGIFTTETARQEAGKRAAAAVALAEKQSIFEVAFPTIPTESLRDLDKKIKRELGPATEFTVKKLAEVRDAMADLQKEHVARITLDSKISPKLKAAKNELAALKETVAGLESKVVVGVETEGMKEAKADMAYLKKAVAFMEKTAVIGIESPALKSAREELAGTQRIISEMEKKVTIGVEVAGLREAKEKIVEMEKAIASMKKKVGDKIIIPDYITDALEKRRDEMKILEKELLGNIKKMEAAAKAVTGAADGVSGADGEDGEAGMAGRDGLAGKINFVGLKDAWKSMAQSLQPKDKTQENILRETKEQGKTLDRIDGGIRDLEVGMGE